MEKGEKRQLTALFYDLVGSTALISTMDPEDYLEIRNMVHRVADKAISEQDGYLDSLMGDGGCAYFGYPDADEDAARKAVTAALQIINGSDEINQVAAQPVAMRVGVATAPALVGMRGPISVAGSDDIVGLAPTLASRVEGSAKPGTIAIASGTHSIVKGLFEFELLGDFDLKGIPEKQRLWRPIKERAYEDRFAATRTPDTTLVARQDEVDVIEAHWRKAISGSGTGFYISGEPGIGKSRLTKAAIDKTLADEPHLLMLQCEPAGRNIPFFPIARHLRLRILSNEPDFAFNEATSASVKKALNLPGRHEEEFYEYLIRLLVPNDTDEHDTAVGDEDLNDALIAALAAFATAITTEKPTLFIVEDYHWADTQTQKLVQHLLGAMDGIRGLLVVTSRNLLPEILDQSGKIHPFQLKQLGDKDIQKVVLNIVGKKIYSRKLGAAIAQKCGGNPLYAEELARFVMSRKNTAAPNDPEWSEIFSSDKTASLQELLAARLAELGPAKIIAHTASAIGRSFTKIVLVSLLATNGASANIDQHLDKLVRSGFLQVRERTSDQIYSFRHVLVQESAYQGMLRGNQRSLHKAIYELAQKNPKFRAELSEAELAHHAEVAGLLPEAVQHYLRAGRHASQQSALSEAKTLLHQALALAEKQTDADARDQELEAIKGLGPVLTTLEGSGSSEARRLYEKGVSICREATHQERSKWFPIYWGWWFTGEDFKTQRDRADIILTDLAGSNEAEVELQSLHCQWATSFNMGGHRECMKAIERGTSLYNPDTALTDRTRFGGHDAKVCGLGEYGLSLWFTGKTETALKYINDALAWAEEIDHLGSRCHALDIAIMLHRYRIDIDEVMRIAAKMRDLADLHDLISLKAKSQIFEGWAKGINGDLHSGIALLEEGLAIQKEAGTEEDYPVYMEMLAELDELSGNYAAGIKKTSHTIERAKAADHAFWLAELCRRQAALLSADSQSTGHIEAAITDAKRVAMDQGAVLLELRASLDEGTYFAEKRTDAWHAEVSKLFEHIEPGPERDRLSEQLARLRN
ncbi:MAG: adenylate/guanylate cyclase domain-containing protein [Stappiaceae bacterium]